MRKQRQHGAGRPGDGQGRAPAQRKEPRKVRTFFCKFLISRTVVRTKKLPGYGPRKLPFCIGREARRRSVWRAGGGAAMPSVRHGCPQRGFLTRKIDYFRTAAPSLANTQKMETPHFQTYPCEAPPRGRPKTRISPLYGTNRPPFSAEKWPWMGNSIPWIGRSMGWKWKSMGWIAQNIPRSSISNAKTQTGMGVRINGLPYSAHAAGGGGRKAGGPLGAAGLAVCLRCVCRAGGEKAACAMRCLPPWRERVMISCGGGFPRAGRRCVGSEAVDPIGVALSITAGERSHLRTGTPPLIRPHGGRTSCRGRADRGLLRGDHWTGGSLAAPRVCLRPTRGNGKLDPHGVHIS